MTRYNLDNFNSGVCLVNRKTSMILELLNNNVESDITDRKKFKRNNDSALCLYTILNQCITRNGKKRLRSFILRQDFELMLR